MLAAALTLAVLASGAARPVPLLGKDPKVDGNLKDLNPSIAVKPAGAAKLTANWNAKVAFRKETLYLGLEITDDKLTAGDIVEVILAFLDAGTTARGYSYRFAFDGKRAPDPDSGPPAFANDLVQAQVQRNDAKGSMAMTLEAAFPVRALPRMPAKGPLALDLCVTFEDRDDVAATAAPLANCTQGSMGDGQQLRLPDDLRKVVKGKVPDAVDGLEAREGGWLGFAALHYPLWVLGDADLTADSLRKLVADRPIDPKDVDINLPSNLSIKDGRPLVGVLTGKDPYASEGKCEMDAELRVALYAIKGKVGDRVLEWPAATCALGRAISFVLNDEGGLAIGYSNGSTVTFSWSTDHFERTEFGLNK